MKKSNITAYSFLFVVSLFFLEILAEEISPTPDISKKGTDIIAGLIFIGILVLIYYLSKLKKED